jgi:hypothetical protein
MALTVTKTVLTDFMPEMKLIKCDVAFDNSYPTGGETLSLTDQFSAITGAWVGSQSMAVSSKFVKIDYTNVASATINLELHDTTDEETAASDQSAVNDIVIFVFGRAVG